MMINLKRFQNIGVALVALALLGAACSSGKDEPQAVQGVSGVQQRDLTAADLVQRADLVVIGRPVSDTVKPFTANPDIPERYHETIDYQQGSYHDVKVEVTRQIKGTSPRTISIRRHADGAGLGVEGELPEPVLDKEQVLILFKGEGVWVGGWLLFHGGVGLREGDAWKFGEAIGSVTATDADLAAWAKLPPYVPPSSQFEPAPIYP